MQAGTCSERWTTLRAVPGLEMSDAGAEPTKSRRRPPLVVEQVPRVIPGDTSDNATRPAGVVASACVEEETDRNTGSLDGGGA